MRIDSMLRQASIKLSLQLIRISMTKKCSPDLMNFVGLIMEPNQYPRPLENLNNIKLVILVQMTKLLT